MLRDIWKIFTRTDRRNVIALLVVTCFGVVLDVVGIGMVLPLISIMSGAELQETYPRFYIYLTALVGEDREAQLFAVMLLLLLVYIVKNMFLGFILFLQASYSYGLRRRLSKRLFTSYLRKPYSFFFTENTSKLIQVITEETTQFASSILLPVLYVISELAVIVSLIILLIVMTSPAVLFVLIFVVFGAAILYLLLRSKLKIWGEKRQYHESRRIRVIQHALGSIQDVKVFGREEYFKNEFDSHNIEAAIQARNNTFTTNLPRLWLEILGIFSIVLLVLITTKIGVSEVEILSLLGLYMVALFRIMPSVTKVARSLQTIRYSNVVVATITNALRDADTDTEETLGQDISSLSSINFKKISFENVSYRYPSADDLSLKKINLEIHKGQAIGIIGGSGAGKSTILNLLLGLISPTAGCIKVGEKDISTIMSSWRNIIGYVPQKIALLDSDIASNIAFGIPKEEIDLDALKKAIRQANIEDLIQGLPGGINSIVGERGIRLSGGQQQRIGIARALYHDPLVLIFDEATSALDNISEREILDTVSSLNSYKTIIMVAHRLTTLKDCDVVYRIENGEIIESGSFKKVVKPEPKRVIS